MQVTNVGPNPPAVLYLSDGSHIENLGILPLLKLTLTKIVSVEGGRTILDEDYVASLLIALDMARTGKAELFIYWHGLTRYH